MVKGPPEYPRYVPNPLFSGQHWIRLRQVGVDFTIAAIGGKGVVADCQETWFRQVQLSAASETMSDLHADKGDHSFRGREAMFYAIPLGTWDDDS